MVMPDLLEQLDKLSTPGPWRPRYSEEHGVHVTSDVDGAVVLAEQHHALKPADVELICSLKKVLPEIVREKRLVIAVLEAAEALLKKHDAAQESMNAVFVLAHVHGHEYQGPTFGHEIEALRALVKQSKELYG